MKKILLLAVLLAPLALAGCAHRTVVVYEPPPPPSEFSQVAQQAYHNGVVAARRDINAGLPPDVNRHPRFRRPPVEPPFIEDYRHGFRAGYQAVYRNGAPPAGY